MTTTYTCDYCGNKFGSQEECRKHELAHKDIEDKFSNQIHLFDIDKQPIAFCVKENIWMSVVYFLADTKEALDVATRTMKRWMICPPNFEPMLGHVIVFNKSFDEWLDLTQEAEDIQNTVQELLDKMSKV